MKKIALILPLLLAGTVHAETVKFCFTAPADHTDSGFPLADSTTEDYWTTTSDKSMYGVYASVHPLGTLITWADYTDDGFGSDGAGCTPSITATGTNLSYTVRVDSQAFVQGNEIYGRNQDEDISCYREITYNNTTGSGTKTVPIVGSAICKPIWRSLNTAAYALYRHSGGMTGKTYRVNMCTACSTGCARLQMSPTVTRSA